MSFFIIQGCWNNGGIVCEEQFMDAISCDDPNQVYTVTRKAVIEKAERLSKDATFEGDYVRVITIDGDLEWDSRDPEKEEEPSVYCSCCEPGTSPCAPQKDDERDSKLSLIAREMLDIPTLTLSNRMAKVQVSLVDLKQALQLAYKAGQDSK